MDNEKIFKELRDNFPELNEKEYRRIEIIFDEKGMGTFQTSHYKGNRILYSSTNGYYLGRELVQAVEDEMTITMALDKVGGEQMEDLLKPYIGSVRDRFSNMLKKGE
jgi:hypothetical protein